MRAACGTRSPTLSEADIEVTVNASIEETRVAEEALEASVNAAVEATSAAVEPGTGAEPTTGA